MLSDYLRLVEDPRSNINIEHNIVYVLCLAINSILSSAESPADIETFKNEKLEWLRLFRPFTHGVPTRHSIALDEKTIKNCIITLDPMRCQSDA